MEITRILDEGGPRWKRSIGWSRIFCALLFVFGVVWAQPSRALTYYSLPPFPTGTLRYALPTVRWKVWTLERDQVISVRMTLNGRPVPARYSQNDRAAVYTPSLPLESGEYAVHCAILLDSGAPLSRDWEFTVARNALAELPVPDKEPQAALEASNRYRRLMGLPEMHLHNALCAAAQAHSRYLDNNEEYGHSEQPGQRDFTGSDLLERDGAFGYFGGGYENVSSGASAPGLAVQWLFDAPYHRLPFMQPGPLDFGMGRAGRQTTLEFGLSEAEGVVVYPADGQTKVPLTWSGNEDPDPLRLHDARGRVGYIITFAYFRSEAPAISVQSATLKEESGAEVPCFVNTPENDDRLPNGVFLIPERPLRPDRTYTAEVHATTAEGKELSRRWRFTTEHASPSAPARKHRKR